MFKISIQNFYKENAILLDKFRLQPSEIDRMTYDRYFYLVEECKSILEQKVEQHNKARKESEANREGNKSKFKMPKFKMPSFKKMW